MVFGRSWCVERRWNHVFRQCHDTLARRLLRHHLPTNIIHAPSSDVIPAPEPGPSAANTEAA